MQDVIKSKSNRIIEHFADLKTKKGRTAYGQYIIEGLRAVSDSLPYLTDPQLLLSQSAYLRYGERFASYSPYVCDDSIMERVSDTENSQGILCASTIQIKSPDFDCSRALWLDRVRDPSNLGTIIRTALAAGYNDIYCCDCVDAYNPKVVRGTVSAIARVNIYKCNICALEKLKSSGYKLIVADMNGENAFSYSFAEDEKYCLAIGNEAQGVSDDIITMSDIVLALPMRAGESLNAGVSASILMYLSTFGCKK